MKHCSSCGQFIKNDHFEGLCEFCDDVLGRHLNVVDGFDKIEDFAKTYAELAKEYNRNDILSDLDFAEADIKLIRKEMVELGIQVK